MMRALSRVGSPALDKPEAKADCECVDDVNGVELRRP